MKLRPLKMEDPLLRKKCISIEKKDLRKQQIQEKIEGLLDFVYGSNNTGDERLRTRPMTVGLSANQVGMTERISVVDLAIGRKSYSDIHVLINPEIIKKSKTTQKHTEGCVNFPSIWGEVERYKSVTVKALDRSGNEIILKLTGWPAVLLQHEIDHLNGILFIDHLTDPTKAHYVTEEDYMTYKKNKKEWRKTIDVSTFLYNIKHVVLNDE